MDLLRSRAIPALIAALAACGAQAACDKLNGTYRYEAGIVDARPRYLSDLTLGPERRKLIKSEAPAKAQGLGGSQLRSRPKETHLAATGKLAAVARGATIEFHDAHGKALATIGIGQGWSCKGDRLERDEEHTAGLGDNVRTERVQEMLEKAGSDLVYTQTVTVIEPRGGKPKRSEVKFPAVK